MVVRNENVQKEGNSLLKTAVNKRVGPGQFANLVLRAAQRPPLKKVKVPSDASRVSDLTGSIIEDVRPVIKEIDNFDVESSVLGMSVLSAGPDSSSADIGKDTPVAGKAVQSKPQPAPYRLPIRNLRGPVQKKQMEIQPGIRFTAPSPMTLDRIEVQMGQERTAPVTEDYKKQAADAREDEEIEQQKREEKKAKMEKAKEIKEKFISEEGEGFEAQLDDFEQDSPKRKKSIIKALIGQIRLSPKKAMSPRRARAMAREALKKSGKFGAGVMQPQGILGKDIPIPVDEIIAGKRQDSISDLDASQKRKAFPLREVVQARDDESVSTLGLAHALERIKPVVIAEEITPALIDKIDSGTMTENAEAATNGFGACVGKTGSQTVKNLSMALGALCMHPTTQHEDVKGLSQIIEELSPLPTGEKRYRYSSPRGTRGFYYASNGVIDLTKLGSPRSPSTQDGVKGARVSDGQVFSFDDAIDMAISKLNSKSADRYAVEGDESPRKEAFGRKIARGKGRGKDNEITPRASGANLADDSYHSSFEEDDGVRKSKSPSRKNRKNKSFAGYLSDGLFDLLSMDESVARGRQKVPFLSGSASDADSIENGFESAMNGKIDPSLGVMCGAVPLYFMYDENDNQGKRRVSRRKSRDVEFESDEEEDLVSEVEASSPKASSPKKKSGSSSPKKGQVSSPKNKKSSNVNEDMSAPSSDSSSEEKARPGHGILKGGQTYKQNKEKALLEKDDAYWDGLSTIDSTTKGKSEEDTSKQAEGTEAAPGPIPGEITMTQDKEKKKDFVQQTIDKKVENAMSQLTALVGDEKSTADSLSAKLEALEARKNARDNSSDPAKDDAGTPKGSNRNVSWGFEEIYEAAETVESPKSSTAPETTGSGSTSQELSDKEEQELISRTLKLSRQLLASMSAQEFGGPSEAVKSLLSFNTEDSAAKSSLPDVNSIQVSNGSTKAMSSASSTLDGLQIGNTESSPIDVEELFTHYDNISARAPGNRVPGRERDRLSTYGQTMRAHSAGRATTNAYISTAAARRSRSAERVSQSMMGIPEDSDSVNTTASMKARQLRRQLDEALQASRNIRNSQAQLGSELESFKSRFYNENTRLEDQAIQAMNGVHNE